MKGGNEGEKINLYQKEDFWTKKKDKAIDGLKSESKDTTGGGEKGN